ncbi:MAG: hypothetical protein GY849_15520, partial [Deltaproteobacteria bacterium]|nr:hypothetical protein [Deltaproteobacteria bacterium]
GCVKLTAQAAVILADLLNEFEKDREIDVHTFHCLPRDHVELGGCPFSPGA